MAPAYRLAQRDGRIVGDGGYLGGEELQVHRDVPGPPTALECATFRFTREPWPT